MRVLRSLTLATALLAYAPFPPPAAAAAAAKAASTQVVCPNGVVSGAGRACAVSSPPAPSVGGIKTLPAKAKRQKRRARAGRAGGARSRRATPQRQQPRGKTQHRRKTRTRADDDNGWTHSTYELSREKYEKHQRESHTRSRPTKTSPVSYQSRFPIRGKKAPRIVLKPHPHPEVDMFALESLVPRGSATLHYRGPPILVNKHGTESIRRVPMANVHMTQLTFPAVVLDHTALIGGLTCTATTLSITFTTNAGFKAARAKWVTAPGPFVLMSYHPDCGEAAQTGERDFIRVDNISFDPTSNSATAEITMIPIHAAVEKDSPIKVDMAHFHLNDAGEQAGFSAGSIPGGGGGPDNGIFDISLDDAIGYLCADEMPLKKRRFSRHSHLHRLVKRKSIFTRIRDAFRSAANDIKDAAEAAAHAIKEAAEKAYEAAKAAAEAAAAAIKKLLFTPHTITPFNQDYALDLTAGHDSTPWGPGLLLFDYGGDGKNLNIDVFCVGCGLHGTLHLRGSLTFTLAQGITEGALSVEGAARAVLQVGIVAEFERDFNYNQPLFNLPLSPFDLPGIIDIGPQITLTAGATLNIQAHGQLLAGLQLEWDKLYARIALDSKKSDAGGWRPRLTPVFEAEASLEIDATAWLKLELGIGITMMGGKLSAQVGLVEEPIIPMSARISAAAELVPGPKHNGTDWRHARAKGTVGDDDCHGSALGLNFTNNVYIDVLSADQVQVDTWDGPRMTDCLKIGKQPSPQARQAWQHSTRLFSQPRSSRVKAAPRKGGPVRYSTTDGAWDVHWADNGNLYAVDPKKTKDTRSAKFAAPAKGFVIGDLRGRAFHGYVDTIRTYGVSRFRLSDEHHVPKTAVML